MTLTEQIYAQALVLAQDLEEEKTALLEVLCRASENALRRKLRPGVAPEDCKADFIAAASLYALAALSDTDEVGQMAQIQLGDLTLRRSSPNAAACCLRYQAEMLMLPYVRDGFSFMGV
ncbi:MAG: hypothetical protein LUJ09_03225 [Firmicutes bacterium]|nr:hypothetical protein [Bacillota bacterium]